MRRGKYVQLSENGSLESAKLGNGIGVDTQRGLNLVESVFQLHNAAGEVYEIVRQGSNLAVLSGGAVLVGVARVAQTGLEATNF